MEPGILIKIERQKRGWSQEFLARQVPVSQPAIRKIEKGETKKSKHFPRLGEILGIPLARLDSSLSQNRDGTINHPIGINAPVRNPTLQIIPGSELMGEADLPVYSIVQAGKGALVLENEPFTHTARPKRLLGKRDGYGVLVIGNSMAPEYNENDIAYIDPRLHPRTGDPCVFQGTREDGAVEAMMKYLDRSPDASETLYYVRTGLGAKPVRKFTVKKADWQRVHVAVGKESGR